eukprot:765768-Pelagomonas_calceolata.AAC.2
MQQCVLLGRHTGSCTSIGHTDTRTHTHTSAYTASSPLICACVLCIPPHHVRRGAQPALACGTRAAGALCT